MLSCKQQKTTYYSKHYYLHNGFLRGKNSEKFGRKSCHGYDFGRYVFFLGSKMWSRVLILFFFLLSILHSGASFQFLRHQTEIETLFVKGRDIKESENYFSVLLFLIYYFFNNRILILHQYSPLKKKKPPHATSVLATTHPSLFISFHSFENIMVVIGCVWIFSFYIDYREFFTYLEPLKHLVI